MHITVMTVLVAAGALLLSWPQATAQDQPSRMLRFLEAAGIRSLMEQQWAAQQALARVHVEQMMSRMRSQLPAIPEQQASELDRMTQEMIEALGKAYTVDEVLRVYAQPFDQNYPGAELDKATQELSTPSGQRLVRTINEAVTAIYQFTSARQQEVLSRETEKFMARLKVLLGQSQKP